VNGISLIYNVPCRPPAKKSSNGCWTCKRRKIGCDKTLPHCSNCLRTDRICEGYGIKLYWPGETHDGRRAEVPWEGDNRTLLKLKNSRGSHGFHFLNTSYEDFGIGEDKNGLPWRREALPNRFKWLGPLRSLSYGFEVNLKPKDGILLGYYNAVLSRIITTIDDGLNGFRTVLLPNAFSEQILSSQSLRQSILAVSASHLWGHDAAIQYKLNAIRLLSKSIQSGEDGLAGRFATCMMLCVGDVFDAADGSWATHLRAAKAMNKQMQRRNEHNAFFDTWLAYHEVLARFSHSSAKIKQNEIAVKLPSPAFEDTVIIGSLGCSLQVLKCISCVNDLTGILAQSRDKILPAVIASYPEILQSQLETLQQTQDIIEDSTCGRIDSERISTTAELYRLATLIYLHQSIIGTSQDSEIMRDLVARGLTIIDSLGLCTSPWPLFMIACEVMTDEERIRVLDALDKMRKERRIGNVEIMRSIIETVWKQFDIAAGSNQSLRPDWKQLLHTHGQIPSFI